MSAMKVGIVVPQGWTGEYAGVRPADAWRRTVEVAQRSERLGFESLWLFDHMHTTPEPRDEPVFESFTALSALAAVTRRARLGHLVSCAAYRNPALEAKMVSTMDVISGGRMELGIGAGWKRDEYVAYGFDFPSTRERLRLLEESLEVVTRMLGPGRARWTGHLVRVDGAINEPKPLQEHLPIIVGGNGREVTWRLAARFADELNVDGMPADEIVEARGDLDRRCEEVRRDPGTLRLSAHVWWEQLDAAPSRAEMLAGAADAGVSRVMTLVRAAAWDLDELDRFAEECRAAGVELASASAA